MGFTSLVRSLFFLVLALIVFILIFKFFFLLNHELESHVQHLNDPKGSKTRTGKNLLKNDVDSHQGIILFPPNESVCPSIPDNETSTEIWSCLPIHRCFNSFSITTRPLICGWSGLLPDVCCPTSSTRNATESPVASVGPHVVRDGNCSTSSGDIPVSIVTRKEEAKGTTMETVTEVTTRGEPVLQTKASETSGRKESISSPHPITRPSVTTAINRTDVTASTTERPFTSSSASGATPDKSSITGNSSTGSPLTSEPREGSATESSTSAESLAWSTRGPTEGGMHVTSVSGVKLMKEETPKPVIDFKNSPYCGLSDGEHSVWPFIAAIHEAKGMDETAVFLCSAVILSRRYIGVSESCLKNNLVDFTSDRAYDLRIRTNDHGSASSSKHLVDDIILSSPSPPDPITRPSASDHLEPEDNGRISSRSSMRLAILRVAPKITFSSIVKPVCLPLPADESVNDGESTKDLLFASHVALTHVTGKHGHRPHLDDDEGLGDSESSAGSAATSLITSFRSEDGGRVTRVTDQRLEVPRIQCLDMMRKLGMESHWRRLLDSRSHLMCALNSPLFSLNCRSTPGGLVLHQQNSRWTIRGIEVLQTDCGHFMSPGLYIDFADRLLLGWISGIIASN